MLDPTIFFRGLLIGFSIAAPVGPIGVLCIRRTLAEGRLAGFLSGMGAASADMFYGAVAAFGLTAVQNILIGQSIWLRVIGGIFLLYLGAKTFLAKPAEKAAESRRGGLFGVYLTTRSLSYRSLPSSPGCNWVKQMGAIFPQHSWYWESFLARPPGGLHFPFWLAY